MRTVLSVSVSVVAAFLVARTIDLATFLAALERVHIAPLLVAFSLNSVLFLFGSWRLQRLYFALGRKPKLAHFYRAVLIGFFGNVVLPLRAGELAKAAIVSRHGNSARSTALSVVFVERVSDFTVVLVLLFMSLFIVGTDKVRPISVIALSAVLLIAVVAMVLVSHRPELIGGVIGRLLRSKKGVAATRRFASGFALLRQTRGFFWTLGTTLLFWTVQYLIYYFATLSLGFQITVPHLLFLLAVTAFGSAIPSGPAQLGTLEGAIVVAMGIIGIPAAESLPFAVVYHASQIAFVLLFGAIAVPIETSVFGGFRQLFRPPGVSA